MPLVIIKVPPLESACFCHQCNDLLHNGDNAFETVLGTYCCEACADEAEAHNDGLMGQPRTDNDHSD